MEILTKNNLNSFTTRLLENDKQISNKFNDKISKLNIKSCLTVEEMKNNTEIFENDIIITSGYYVAGDGGGAKYFITSDAKEFNHYEPLSNGLYANLIIEVENIYPRQWGAHFNG